MQFLRQHDIIPTELLRELADEVGVGWSRRKRVAFFTSFVCLVLGALVAIMGFVGDAIKGDGFSKPVPLLVILSISWITPWAVWMEAKAARLRRVRRVMLKYLRCPHCGYDIRELATDPADGTTVCPECGCAWLLEASQYDGGQEEA